MSKHKKNKMVYWTLTILFLLPTAGSGIPELFTSGPEQVVASLQLLGYPLYLMKILGLAKILGAVAILGNFSEKLKEWAYAGFTFNFIGAAASHALADDYGNIAAPIIILALSLGSYFFWNKIKKNITES